MIARRHAWGKHSRFYRERHGQLSRLSDTMAFRLVGSWDHTSGWIDRIVIAQPAFPQPVNGTTRGNVAAAPVLAGFNDVNNENSRTVRASFLLDERRPTGCRLEPTFMYQEAVAGRPQPHRQSARNALRTISSSMACGAVRGPYRHRQSERQVPFTHCRSDLDDILLDAR